MIKPFSLRVLYSLKQVPHSLKFVFSFSLEFFRNNYEAWQFNSRVSVYYDFLGDQLSSC